MHSGGVIPPLNWASLSVDLIKNHFAFARFDGESAIESGNVIPEELGDLLRAWKSRGVDLVATGSLPTPDASSGQSENGYELLVPLNDWSQVLGFDGPLVVASANEISERLGLVFERLIDLDPTVLQSAIDARGFRGGGEANLLASALAHSSARHPDPGAQMELMFLSNRTRPERLKARKDGAPVDPKAVAALFANDGPLASHYTDWEERPQQTALAVEVATTLAQGGQTITEAGTGTGKSLAYLVPSLLHAIGTGEQVVVATNTRVLQEQLATKDAPIAVDAIRHMQPDENPTVHVLKGRGNYVCLRRWFGEVATPTLSAEPGSESFRSRATIWLSLTSSGDRSELPLDRDGDRLFHRVSAEGESCDAPRCQFQMRNQCFLYRARRNADAAHVVITNHALLLTDVVQGGEALPDAKHLIIDEAHHLEDQATSSFQTSVSMRLLTAALNTFASDGHRPGPPGLLVEIDSFFGSKVMASLEQPERDRVRNAVGSATRSVDSVRTHAALLFTGLGGLVESSGEHARDYASRLRITPALRNGTLWTGIESSWDSLNLALASLISNLEQVQSQLPELGQLSADMTSAEQAMLRVEDIENRLGTGRHALAEIAELLNGAIHNPLGHMVYWLESRQRDSANTTLYAAPLALGDYLNQHLYNRLDSLVLTSATMTTAGTTTFVRNRLGLPDASELHVTSPFDYERNALLVLPADIPEPNQAGFDAASHRAILATATAANGRTLVLFTSLAAMNAARLALVDQFAAAGLVLVTQHEDGSAEQLAERLRSFERTVVFGAGAFWEGVDVPGPALSALVITKLPFAVPTDPVIAARSETFDNPFMDYSLPQATLKVRQGFGRLIRSRTDRGVCVLLDRRITSKRYGKLILDTLPPTRREYGTIAQTGEIVRRFLDEGGIQ